MTASQNLTKSSAITTVQAFNTPTTHKGMQTRPNSDLVIQAIGFLSRTIRRLCDLSLHNSSKLAYHLHWILIRPVPTNPSPNSHMILSLSSTLSSATSLNKVNIRLLIISFHGSYQHTTSVQSNLTKGHLTPTHKSFNCLQLENI